MNSIIYFDVMTVPVEHCNNISKINNTNKRNSKKKKRKRKHNRPFTGDSTKIVNDCTVNTRNNINNNKLYSENIKLKEIIYDLSEKLNNCHILINKYKNAIAIIEKDLDNIDIETTNHLKYIKDKKNILNNLK